MLKIKAFIMRMFGIKKISGFQKLAIPLQISTNGSGLEIKLGALINNATVNIHLQAARKMNGIEATKGRNQH